MKLTVTVERLRELLHYDAETGAWTWRVSAGTHVKVGDVAGCLHPGRGYRAIGIEGRRYHAHRLAWFWMTGQWPLNRITHINMQHDDNRIANLREATPTPDRAILTQERLRELFHYDQDTGDFTWRETRWGHRAGDVAGCDMGHGYRKIGFDGQRHYAHRLAWLWMTGGWPEGETDQQPVQLTVLRLKNSFTNSRGLRKW